MKEELKQAIESWILQDQRRVDKQSHLGLCLLVLQQISILRHADPEIMKQAGWVREDEFMQDLMNRTFDKMKTKDNHQEIKSILSKIKPKP